MAELARGGRRAQRSEPPEVDERSRAPRRRGRRGIHQQRRSAGAAMQRIANVLPLAALVLAACADPIGPGQTLPGRPTRAVTYATAQEMFARYVAMGTSNSQGAMSA